MQIEKMIELLNSDLKNEWMHLKFYLYHASAVVGLHRQEYREFFLNESISEMKHVQEFSDLIWGLGGLPTLEFNEFPLFVDPLEIIQYAFEMETKVVENYTQRIEQAVELGGTDGKYLEIFLEKQIEKSREDVDNYKKIIAEKNIKK